MFHIKCQALCGSLFMESPLSPLFVSLPLTLNPPPPNTYYIHSSHQILKSYLSPRPIANVFSFLWSFLISVLSSFSTRYKPSFLWLQSILYFSFEMYITSSNLFFKLFLLFPAHLSKSFLKVGSIMIINYIPINAQSSPCLFVGAVQNFPKLIYIYLNHATW